MKKRLFPLSLLSLLLFTHSSYSDECCCYDCPQGPRGRTGPQGPAGKTGPQGPAGASLDFADFYALIPQDNSLIITAGKNICFPQDGPASGGNVITRVDADSFNLAKIGTYQVLFQVGVDKASIDKAGQLVITLNSGSGAVELLHTVTGKVTGSSQIVGMVLIQTTTENSILTLSNPKDSPVSLKVTPATIGTHPVSAHLLITQIQ